MALAAAGCEDDDSPTGPTPVAGDTTPVAGATQVRGTEHIAWLQVGDTSRLHFRAYVNNRAVDLPAATCTRTECSSPLPALSDGVNTIQLVNVLAGIESERSESITIQKAAARAFSTALPLAAARGGVRLDSVVKFSDGLEFTADIVTIGVRGPAQLATLPDGRLLISDADGRVRIMNPGEPENPAAALDAGSVSTTPIGPMGIATHPHFAENRFVYVSLLERERSDQMRLRVLRTREVGNTLGEPATLFEAPVGGDETVAQVGPRMAFGPDRLLYVMLPSGLQFVNEPAASTPLASMLRLSDEGRAASEPLSGLTATPLAFSWSPTGALWVMVRGTDGIAAVRSLDGRARVQAMSGTPAGLRIREGIGTSAGTLFLQPTPDDALVARALVSTRADGSKGVARLAMPVQTAREIGDRIVDVVAGDGGTLFVATSNALPGSTGAASDVVVRLRPVARRP